jgi:hypothetical protein
MALQPETVSVHWICEQRFHTSTAMSLQCHAPLRKRRPAKEIIHDLARALAIQMAEEDDAAEQAREEKTACELPSTPGSAQTSRMSDR